MRGLKDKRVVITGGASGIGAATAARFLEEGSRVCVVDRDATACEHIRHELRGLGEAGITSAIIADVTDLMQVEAAFAEAIRLMDGIDVLINNAGISIRHKFLDITPEEWEKVISVNLTGVFYVAQTAARHMWENGSGVILQTASTNGVMGYPYYAAYNASKAGVIELTRSMALELAPKVRVCAVAPGYVLTPMQRAATPRPRRLRDCSPISHRTTRRLPPVMCSRWMEARLREAWPADDVQSLKARLIWVLYGMPDGLPWYEKQ
jgi:NAD(P)-dependent dehydrogenase (short-subunit alcohol dehydrogenase family)